MRTVCNSSLTGYRASQVRSAGVFASLFMSSVLLRENVLALIMAQVRARRCSAAKAL